MNPPHCPWDTVSRMQASARDNRHKMLGTTPQRPEPPRARAPGRLEVGTSPLHTSASWRAPHDISTIPETYGMGVHA